MSDRTLGVTMVRMAIRAYQAVTAHRLPSCRYWPSCSAYALEAVETHGGWRGGWLALRRLARCGPWGGWGADPVPGAGGLPVQDSPTAERAA